MLATSTPVVVVVVSFYKTPPASINVQIISYLFCHPHKTFIFLYNRSGGHEVGVGREWYNFLKDSFWGDNVLVTFFGGCFSFELEQLGAGAVIELETPADKPQVVRPTKISCGSQVNTSQLRHRAWVSSRVYRVPYR